MWIPASTAHDVLTLRLSVPPGVVAPDSMPGFYDQLQAEIARRPGRRAGCHRRLPATQQRLQRHDHDVRRPATEQHRQRDGGRSLGFARAGSARCACRSSADGRSPTPIDLVHPRCVVINEAAARQYFRGEDPIGKRVGVYQGGFHTGAEVIGIVGDVRYGTIDSTARPDVYISYGQARLSRMMVFVRTTGDPSALAPAVRAAVARVAPHAPVFDVRSMSARVATATAADATSAPCCSGSLRRSRCRSR